MSVPIFDEFTRLKNEYLKQICPTCDLLKEKTVKKHTMIKNKIDGLQFIKSEENRNQRIKQLQDIEIPNFENLQKVYKKQCDTALIFDTNLHNTDFDLIE